MTTTAPTTSIDSRFGDAGVEPVPWKDAQRALDGAELYWLVTVRVDGRPHVTPLIGVWHHGAMHFCTGPDEQKANNLEGNPQCVLLTGRNDLHGGLDIVVEGEAVRVTADFELSALARLWETKYGPEWHFDARDGQFHHGAEHGAGHAFVFRIDARKALGFGKGPYSQTRWSFAAAS